MPEGKLYVTNLAPSIACSGQDTDWINELRSLACINALTPQWPSSLIVGLVFFRTILGILFDFVLKLRQNPNSIPRTKIPPRYKIQIFGIPNQPLAVNYLIIPSG
jgi:hypothetical protein